MAEASASNQKSLCVVVCGPCGCGKTTVATELARRLGWSLVEGDALHSEESIAKMSRGQPLTDADRLPWLRRIRTRMAESAPSVVACSALTRAYRDCLRGREPTEPSSSGDGGDTSDPSSAALVNCIKPVFCCLELSERALVSRMEARVGHFMKAGMVQSQLAIWEKASAADEPDSVVLDGEQPVSVVVETFLAHPLARTMCSPDRGLVDHG